MSEMTLHSKVKSLISTLLKEERQKGADTEKAWIVKIVKGKKQEGETLFDIGSEFSTPRDYRRSGYNQALRDILNSLN